MMISIRQRQKRDRETTAPALNGGVFRKLSARAVTGRMAGNNRIVCADAGAARLNDCILLPICSYPSLSCGQNEFPRLSDHQSLPIWTYPFDGQSWKYPPNFFFFYLAFHFQFCLFRRGWINRPPWTTELDMSSLSLFRPSALFGYKLIKSQTRLVESQSPMRNMLSIVKELMDGVIDLICSTWRYKFSIFFFHQKVFLSFFSAPFAKTKYHLVAFSFVIFFFGRGGTHRRNRNNFFFLVEWRDEERYGQPGGMSALISTSSCLGTPWFCWLSLLERRRQRRHVPWQ